MNVNGSAPIRTYFQHIHTKKTTKKKERRSGRWRRWKKGDVENRLICAHNRIFYEKKKWRKGRIRKRRCWRADVCSATGICHVVGIGQDLESLRYGRWCWKFFFLDQDGVCNVRYKIDFLAFFFHFSEISKNYLVRWVLVRSQNLKNSEKSGVMSKIHFFETIQNVKWWFMNYCLHD